MNEDEKAKHLLEVERAKSLLRVEETFPDADACADCAEARRASSDPTDLCAAHLKRIYGI
jgi:hypothetical protein